MIMLHLNIFERHFAGTSISEYLTAAEKNHFVYEFVIYCASNVYFNAVNDSHLLNRRLPKIKI